MLLHFMRRVLCTKLTGAFIDIANSLLGARPNGLVVEDGLIVVKCLHLVQEGDLSEAVKDKKKGL